jgi:hypothetical protein
MWDLGDFVRHVDVLQALCLWSAAYYSALLHLIQHRLSLLKPEKGKIQRHIGKQSGRQDASILQYIISRREPVNFLVSFSSPVPSCLLFIFYFLTCLCYFRCSSCDYCSAVFRRFFAYFILWFLSFLSQPTPESFVYYLTKVSQESGGLFLSQLPPCHSEFHVVARSASGRTRGCNAVRKS